MADTVNCGELTASTAPATARGARHSGSWLKSPPYDR